MISEASSDIQSEMDMEKFKKALLDEKDRKLEAIRQETEKRISDLIVDKRLIVEKKVSSLRKEQKERYERFIKREEEAINHLVLTQVEDFSSELMELMEKRILSGFEDLLSNKGKYRIVLNKLAGEGLQIIDGPVDIQVEPGQSDLIDRSDRIENIHEKDTGSCGGCIIFSADGRIIIDNRLLYRWKRIKPEYLRRLSVKIIEKSLQIPGFFE